MEGKIDTFANRLLIAMKKNNINQVELSEKTKTYGKVISQSLINKYLKGKALARQNNIYILCKILDVDEAWIMGYDVPMQRTPDDLRGKISNVRYAEYNGLNTAGLTEKDIEEIKAYIEIKRNMNKNKIKN